MEGRYDEALHEFVWFHEHALAEQPSLYGVRLSYGLFYWMELAALYPPARVTLEQIRDRKTTALLSNLEDRDVFHDIASINDHLLEQGKTHALFVKLVASNPEFAEACSRYALPSLVLAGDFELAERFSPDPEHQLRELGTDLNRTIQRRKQGRYSPAPRIKAEIHIYAEKVKQLMVISDGLGKKTESARLQQVAIQSIQATSIRKAVAAALEPNARPWFERAYRK